MEQKDLIWEDLGVGDLKILQDKNGYRFTSDAVILANFVKAKPTDTLVEFCFGSGIISTLIAYKENPKQIFGFEVQKSAFDKAIISLKENNLLDKITLFNQKNNSWKKFFEPKSVDIVVCNPPYQKKGDGAIPKIEEVAISKTELETNLQEIVMDAKKLLKQGGAFYICMQPERVSELLSVLVINNFGIENLAFSYASASSNASCVFVKAINEKKQKTTILSPIITHNDKGDYVKTVRSLF